MIEIIIKSIILFIVIYSISYPLVIIGIKRRHYNKYRQKHVFCESSCFSCPIYPLGFKGCRKYTGVYDDNLNEDYPLTKLNYSIVPHYEKGNKYFRITAKCGLLPVPILTNYHSIEEAEEEIMKLKNTYVKYLNQHIEENKKDLSDNITLHKINNELKKL